MYKLCKTAQSAQRQKELERGLLEVMKNCRYQDISVSDLCVRLGVPRKTFYRYFDSKEGALCALIDHSLMEYQGLHFSISRAGKEILHVELEQFFRFWHEKKPLLDVLETNGLSGMLVQRVIAFSVSDALVPRRVLPDDPEHVRRYVTVFGVCGLLSLVLTWHHEGFTESYSELARIGERVLSEPLFPGT